MGGIKEREVVKEEKEEEEEKEWEEIKGVVSNNKKLHKKPLTNGFSLLDVCLSLSKTYAAKRNSR